MRKKIKLSGNYILIIIELILIFIPLLFYPSVKEQRYEYKYNNLVNSNNNKIYELGSFSLKRGVYRGRIDYFTDNDSCKISVISNDKILMDEIYLESLKTSQEFQFWVLEDMNNVQFVLEKPDEDTLFNTNSFSIARSIKTLSMYVVLLVVIILIGHFLRYWVNKIKKDGVKSIQYQILLLIIIIFNFLLSYQDRLMVSQTDLDFHLYRIEGIAAALSQGQFPVRIHPLWMNNYGYATSIFYGELFLYIPAILRILGFPLEYSYNIFLFIIHSMTILVSYFSFKTITRREELGLLGAVLLSLCQYRMVDLSYRGAIGEWQAFAFAPLCLVSVYKLLFSDKEEDGYKYNYIIGVIGFTGLIQSHILSCMMVGLFVILTCIIFLKRTLKGYIFISLTKIVILTTLLNLWFIGPMIDYMRDRYFFNDGSRDHNTIQEYGIRLENIFSASIGEMKEMIPAALGSIWGFLFLGSILYEIIIYNIQKRRGERTRIVLYLIVMAFVALFLSTRIFPYNYLRRLSILNTLFITIQFPWRFLLIASIYIVLLLCMVLLDIKEQFHKKIYSILIVGIGILGVIPAIRYDYVGEQKFFSDEKYYDVVGMDSFSQIAGEYIPSGTDVAYLNNTYVYNLDGKVYIKNYEIDKGIIKAYCINNSNESGKITVPLLYYRGYRAYDEEYNIDFLVEKDENNSLQVVIPPDYEGIITVKFKSFISWRIMEVISILTGIFVVISIIHNYRVKNKYEKNNI